MEFNDTAHEAVFNGIANMADVQGLGDFLKFLDASPKKMQRGMHVGLEAGAEVIVASAKENCPVGPPNSENVRLHGDYEGALRDSIHASMSEKNSKVSVTIKAGGKLANGADIYYAHLIEFTGAAPHIITGKHGPLSFNGRTYASVNHPGMQAKPFLRPALDAGEVAVIGIIDQQIAAALKN